MERITQDLKPYKIEQSTEDEKMRDVWFPLVFDSSRFPSKLEQTGTKGQDVTAWHQRIVGI